MIYQDFSYECPTNINEAVALLSEKGVRSCPIAGGTDLTIALRSNSVKINRIVDINRIPELKRIEDNQKIVIGAAVTFNEIIENPMLQKQLPVLVEGCKYIGSEQIRNAATIGGNVANAAVPADSIPILVCLGADAILQTPQGEVRIPVSELIIGPNKTKIPEGGIIKSFEIPHIPAEAKTNFQRIGRRRSMSIARLSMAAMGSIGSDGKIHEARLVAGSAFPTFKRIQCVEDILTGKKPEKSLFVAAGKEMAEEFVRVSGKRWSTEWKVKAIAAITERALNQVFGGSDEN
jgi:CO/xanthine dehydrogenase FAD-binding subunit